MPDQTASQKYADACLDLLYAAASSTDQAISAHDTQIYKNAEQMLRDALLSAYSLTSSEAAYLMTNYIPCYLSDAKLAWMVTQARSEWFGQREAWQRRLLTLVRDAVGAGATHEELQVDWEVALEEV